MMLNKWMQNLDPSSQDLYLCNFRVSVEGEWLCLREITDDPLSDIFTSQCLISPDLPFLLGIQLLYLKIIFFFIKIPFYTRIIQ